MRTLLILPKFDDSDLNNYDMPLGILYISAVIKKAGKDLHTLNLNHIEGSVKEAVTKAINDINPDVCASGSISVYFETVHAIFQAARLAKPNIINIAGGGIVSADPEMAANLLDIDIGVIGEGEQTIIEILDALSNNTPLEEITGIVLNRANKPPLLTKDRVVNRDLSDIPWPDFAGFQLEKLLDLQAPQTNYVFNLYNKPKAVPIISSRSCPLSCTFCYHPNGKVYRERELDDFFAELDHLIATYDINIIMVLDELLSLKKKRLTAFCERIKPYGLQWLCQLHEKSIDKETLGLLKESGCAFISLGIESMSEPILKSMKKLTTPQKLANAIDLIYESNIGLQGNLLFGDPAETLETTADSFDYWTKHPEYTLNFNVMQVLPGSEIYNNAVSNGRIKSHTEAFKNPKEFRNITTMSNEYFLALYERIKFYSLTLIHVAKTEFFSISKTAHPVLGNGYSCHWRCKKCKNVNKYENLFTKEWGLTLTCRHCLARAYVQMWSQNLVMNPQADLQLSLAERHEEIFKLTDSTEAYQNSIKEYHKLLNEHCLPLSKIASQNSDKPWACVKAYLKIGRYFLQQGDIKNASILIMHNLLANIWNPESHVAFAEVLVQEGSLGIALLYYKKAIELSNDPQLSWIESRDEIENLIKNRGLQDDKVTLYFNSFKN
ncbi:MAG: B12-binding domain-containing radical SAM protein [Magnetococcales bacterium]|nr:B12-binding domain-containing radical SAM protein [Magnetococcales bacterium]